jgi:hypothetical protein
MPLITVNKGGVEIEPGVYQVILTAIEQKTIVPNNGPNAGEEVEIFDWKFAIESGELEGTEINVSSSTRSGPRSKLYGFLVALFGGASPPAGTNLEEGDLVGRSALATIEMTDSGWPKIVNLGAIPKGFNGKPAAAPIAQPVAAAATAKPAAKNDSLPF